MLNLKNKKKSFFVQKNLVVIKKKPNFFFKLINLKKTNLKKKFKFKLLKKIIRFKASKRIHYALNKAIVYKTVLVVKQRKLIKKIKKLNIKIKTKKKKFFYIKSLRLKFKRKNRITFTKGRYFKKTKKKTNRIVKKKLKGLTKNLNLFK